MTPALIALSMVGTFALVLCVVLLNASRKKAAAAKVLAALRAAAPTTWKHMGLPPPAGVETALRVIVEALSGLPARGVIEWMPYPYTLDGFGPVAGNVQSFDPVHVRVSVAPLVEKTALAHELTHVWDALLGHVPRESPGDAGFVAQFTAINLNIAVALNR